MTDLANLITVTETELDEELVKKYKTKPYESVENIRKMM